MRRNTLAPLAIGAILILAGCSGGDDGGGAGEQGGGGGETWAGQTVPYASAQDFKVGTWRGQHGQLTVTCEGDAGSPTITVESPDGDTAVVEPGSNGEGATITVSDGEGTSASGESQDVSVTGGEMDFLNTPRPISDAGMTFNGKFTCAQ